MISKESVRSIVRTSLILGLFFALLPAAMGQANVKGVWTTQSGLMPINPIHTSLMYNGKILVVTGSANCPPTIAGCPTAPPYGPANNSGALVYDPVAGTFTGLTVTWDMFCNGMVPLPDGRIFINGGVQPPSYDPFNGTTRSSIFDPSSNTFTDVQNMAHGRWYPTVTVLGDGRIMTFSGTDENGETNSTVELFTVGSGWSQPITSGFTPPLYPRMHVLPNGKVFYSGPGFNSALFDPSSTTWSLNVAGEIFGNRTYGTSVLLPLTPANGYDPKVMIMGGGNPATNTTEIIDLNASTPQWTAGPNMSQARIEMNAVILPNGKVLALGGSSTDEDSTTASKNADLYNPATNTFTTMAPNVYPRLYHSNALLLPDATVWVAGSNPAFDGVYEKHMEIYQPPYLFNSSGGLATRPTITSVQASVSWGNSFTVTTPDAASIASVVMIKTGSPTHAFDMDQRLVGLNFSVGSGALTATAPPNQNIAPPGHYMLFLVNSSGVPSVAKMVQVIGSTTIPPPPNGVTLEQTNYETPTGTATTVPVAFPLAQAAGNLNIVAVGWNDTSASVNSVVDSRGNAYTLAVGPTSGSGLRQSIYYAKNIAAGSNTVTVTFNKAAALPDIRILEYSGLSTSSPLDVTATGTGTGKSVSTASATTTSANELIFGAGMTAGTFNIAGPGFTTVIFTPDSDNAEQKLVSSTGSYNASASLTYSAAWVMQMATFRASGGTGNPAPTVASVSPGSGSVNGGTPISISGTGFLSGASVTVGGTAATGVTVVSGTSITATTPAHASGAVSVVVRNTDGQTGTLNNAFTYTGGGNPAPTVTAISPNSGSTAGGTPVTITGTGFLAGATVSLGGTAATGVTVVNSTSITATTAAHSAGTVSVVVTNTDAQSGTLANSYTYSTGTGGGGTITFVQVNAANPQTASASVPVAYPAAQTAGNLNIVAVGWNDTTSTVSSITDTRGNSYTQAGTTTTGTGMRQAIYYARNIAAGSNTVTVAFSQAAAFVDVRVLEYSGLDTANPLDVTAVASGTGTSVSSGAATTNSATELIFGAGMTGGHYSAAGTGFVSRIITSPDGDIAEDKIVSATGSNTATATLSYSAPWVMQMATFRASGGGTGNPAPTVTSIAPNNGTTTGGTPITITGTGFLSGATVSLGGTAATGVTVVSSTSITATTAAHTSGAVSVVVTNTDAKSGTLSNGYTYTASNPAPTVTSISPNSGSASGGTPVTITGTGFLAGATVKLGGTAATGVVVVNSTSITATTPAHAGGAVSVVVTNTDAQAGTLNNGYTYINPAPTVTSITPNNGTANGGTPVTITGTGFLAGATVSLGGTPATGVTVVNSTSITATTAAHTAATVSVVVTNTDAQSGTLANGYTYNTSTGGGGTIAFVQVNAADPQTPSASVPVAFTAAQTAGNLNVVAVGWNDTTSTVNSVTDTRGNTYTQAGTTTTGTGMRQAIYYAANIAAGSNTVTVTFNQAAAFVDVRVAEYSGADTSSPLDVTAAAVGTSTAPSSGAATTNSASELIFGAGMTGGHYSAAGTGFTSRIITSPDGDIAEDKIVSVAGSNSATATLSYSAPWIMQMATFRAGGGGTGNPAPTVASIAPNNGTANGGTAVTITGTGFLAGATVSLGGTAATGVTVVNSTTITATTAAHAAGTVSVVVTNTDAKSGTLTNGYTYNSASGGTIAFVQVNAADPQTASASVPVAYPAAQAAGNLNIVAVGWNDTTSTVSSVTDTRGNTYTQAGTTVTGSGLRQAIFYAKNIAAGTNTVTVAFSQAAAFVDLRVLEYSGADTSNPLDVTAGAIGTGGTPSSGAATTSSAKELIFGAGMTTSHYAGAGTGFTSRIITSPDGDIAVDQIVGATGSYSATSVLSYSGAWVMQMATFKALP